MLIGALSLVMQVCCGTSRKRSRRSTFTACWTNGIRSTMPGPARALRDAAEEEDHQPLVLADDVDRAPDQEQEHQRDDDQDHDGDEVFHGAGHTSQVSVLQAYDAARRPSREPPGYGAKATLMAPEDRRSSTVRIAWRHPSNG